MMDAPQPTTTTTTTTNSSNKQAAASVSSAESPISDLLKEECADEDGNPQQGTEHPAAKQQRAVMAAVGNAEQQAPPALNLTRIPPTVKDSRKLFVGGLPQDGELCSFRRKSYLSSKLFCT